MEIKSQKLYNSMLWLSWSSLIVLSLGALTSISLLSLVHISLFLPCLYFLVYPGSNRQMSLSMWLLLGLIFIIMTSVGVNWEIMERPIRNFSRVKYFVFGLLSIFAYRELFKYGISLKQQKILYLILLFAITVATVSGLIGLWTGFNPIRMQEAPSSSRAAGLFGMLMTYAYLLSLMLVILTGILLYARDWSRQFIATKWVVIIYLINLAGLYFTFTRGAWLGLILGVPFLLLYKSKKLFSIIFVSSLIIGGLTYKFVLQETRSTSGSDSIRIALYQAAFEAAKERPLLGYGYRNFEPHSREIKKRHGITPDHFQGHAHNNILEMLAGTGFIGAVFYILFFIAWARELFKRNDLFGYILMAFLASFTISGMVQLTFADGPITFFLMGIYALSLALPVQSASRLVQG